MARVETPPGPGGDPSRSDPSDSGSDALGAAGGNLTVGATADIGLESLLDATGGSLIATDFLDSLIAEEAGAMPALAPSSSPSFGGAAAGADIMDPAIVQTLDARDGGSLALGDLSFMYEAAFVRDGPDLLLIKPDGTAVLVENYFAVDLKPDLTGEMGRILSPELVQSFLMPLAPGKSADASGTQVAQAQGEPIGSVETLTGEVFAVRPDGTRVLLQAGDPVFQGDQVETAEGSSLKITFIDGTIFTLGADARLALDEMVFDADSGSGESAFSILQGGFLFVSGQIAENNPNDMTVTTPVATIGIRGTIVTGEVAGVQTPGGETFRFTVVDGEIAVTAGTETIVLTDNFATVSAQQDEATGQLRIFEFVDTAENVIARNSDQFRALTTTDIENIERAIENTIQQRTGVEVEIDLRGVVDNVTGDGVNEEDIDGEAGDGAEEGGGADDPDETTDEAAGDEELTEEDLAGEEDLTEEELAELEDAEDAEDDAEDDEAEDEEDEEEVEDTNVTDDAGEDGDVDGTDPDADVDGNATGEEGDGGGDGGDGPIIVTDPGIEDGFGASFEDIDVDDLDSDTPEESEAVTSSDDGGSGTGPDEDDDDDLAAGEENELDDLTADSTTLSTSDLVGGVADYSSSSSNIVADFSSVTSDITVSTGSGNDNVKGGSGNDTISTGAGDDTIVGGAGNGNDFYDGGENDDIVTYDSVSGANVADLSVTLYGTGSNTTVSDNGAGVIDTDTLINIEAIRLGDGDDTVDVWAGGIDVDGDVGNDTLDFSSNSDLGPISFSFTDGTTTIGSDVSVFTNFETVLGGQGNDSFTLRSLDHSASGGAGTDTLSLAGFSEGQGIGTDGSDVTILDQRTEGTVVFGGFEKIVGTDFVDTFSADLSRFDVDGGGASDFLTVDSATGQISLTYGSGGDIDRIEQIDFSAYGAQSDGTVTLQVDAGDIRSRSATGSLTVFGAQDSSKGALLTASDWQDAGTDGSGNFVYTSANGATLILDSNARDGANGANTFSPTTDNQWTTAANWTDTFQGAGVGPTENDLVILGHQQGEQLTFSGVGSLSLAALTGDSAVSDLGALIVADGTLDVTGGVTLGTGEVSILGGARMGVGTGGTIGTLDLEGGTLTLSTGTLSVGQFSANSGSMTPTINGDGTVLLTSDTVLDADLHLDGTLGTAASATLSITALTDITGTGVVVNAGAMDIVDNETVEIPTIVNLGTLDLSGGVEGFGVTLVGTEIDNQGVVDVGNLGMFANVELRGGGTLTMNGGSLIGTSEIELTNNSHFDVAAGHSYTLTTGGPSLAFGSGGGVIGGAGTFVNATLFDVDDAEIASALFRNEGTLDVSGGSVDVTGVLDTSEGALLNSSSQSPGKIDVEADGRLIIGSDTALLSGVLTYDIQDDGVLEIEAGGTVSLGDHTFRHGSTLTVDGTWVNSSDFNRFDGSSVTTLDGDGIIVNAGIIHFDEEVLKVDLQNYDPQQEATGLISLGSHDALDVEGTVTGGDWSLANGAELNGTGAVLAVDQMTTGQDNTLSVARLEVTGDLNASHNFEVYGALDLTEGALNSTSNMTIGAMGVLELGTGTDLSQFGGFIDVIADGTASITGGGTFALTQVESSGFFRIGDGGMLRLEDDASVAFFSNFNGFDSENLNGDGQGTLSGPGTLHNAGAIDFNNDRMDADIANAGHIDFAGNLLALNGDIANAGGTVSFADDADAAGTGTITGGDLTLGNGASVGIARIDLDGGTLDITASGATISGGTIDLSSATIKGDSSTDILTIGNATAEISDSTVFDNAGSLVFLSGATLSVAEGNTYSHDPGQSELDLQTGATIGGAGVFVVGTGTESMDGLILPSSATLDNNGTLSFGTDAFNLAGTIQNDGGTLDLGTDGTLTLASGGTIDLDGRILMGGGAEINGATAGADHMRLTGSLTSNNAGVADEISVDLTIATGGILVAGGFDYSAGILDITGAFENHGLLHAESGYETGDVHVRITEDFTNAGTLRIDNGSTLTVGAAGDGTIANTGTLIGNEWGFGGIGHVNAASIANTGVIDMPGNGETYAQVVFNGTDIDSTGGSLTIGNFAEMTVDGGALSLGTLSTFQNDGTLTLTGSELSLQDGLALDSSPYDGVIAFGSGSTLSGNGTLTNYGDQTLDGVTIEATLINTDDNDSNVGTIEVGAGGVLTVNGELRNTFYGQLSFADTAQIVGTGTVTDTSFNEAELSGVTIGTGLTYIGDFSLNSDAALQVDGTLRGDYNDQSSATATITGTGQLDLTDADINGPGRQLEVTTDVLQTGDVTFDNAGGTILVSDANWIMGSGGVFSSGDGTLSIGSGGAFGVSENLAFTYDSTGAPYLEIGAGHNDAELIGAGTFTNASGSELVFNGGDVDASIGSLSNLGTISRESGTLTLGGNVTNTGTISLLGMDGANGDSGVLQVDGVMDNAGILILDDRGNSYAHGATLAVGSDGDFTNSGKLRTQRFGEGSGGSWILSGNIVNASTGTVEIMTDTDIISLTEEGGDATLDVSEGTLNVESGSTLGIGYYGTLIVGDGTTLDGSGVIELEEDSFLTVAEDETFLYDSTQQPSISFEALGAYMTLGGDGTLSNATGSSIVIDDEASGTLATGHIVNRGMLQAESGTMVLSSANVDNAGGTIDILAGSADAALDIRQDLTLDGLIRLDHDASAALTSATLRVDSDAELTVDGTLHSRSQNAALSTSHQLYGDITVTENGFLNIDFDTDFGVSGDVLNIADGSADIATGIRLTTSGTLAVGSETQLTGDGTVYVSGALSVGEDEDFAVPGATTFEFVNGDLIGDGTLTNAESISFRNGTISLDHIANTGTVRIDSGTTTLATTGFDNDPLDEGGGGLLVLDGTGADAVLHLAEDATLDGGVLRLTGDVGIEGATLTTDAGMDGAELTNDGQGTIHVTNGGAAGSRLLDLHINNDALIDIDQAATLAAGRTLDTTSGTLDIASGETFTILGNVTFGSLSVLEGDGTIAVHGQALIASGQTFIYQESDPTFDLASNAGTLTGSGTFENEGTLEIAGATLSVAQIDNDDLLTVTGGQATLSPGQLDNTDGTIDVVADTAGARLEIAEQGSIGGTIRLDTDTGASNSASEAVLAGPSTGSATLTGTLISADTENQSADAHRVEGNVEIRGTVDIDHDLTVASGAVLDSIDGALDIASGEILKVDGVLETGTGTTLSGDGTLKIGGTGRIDIAATEIFTLGTANLRSGTEITVNTSTTGNQTDPVIFQHSNGRIWVGWNEDDGLSNLDRFQIFNADGTKYGTEQSVQALSGTNPVQGLTFIEFSDGTVGAVYHTDTGQRRLRKFDADGDPVGGEASLGSMTGMTALTAVSHGDSFQIVFSSSSGLINFNTRALDGGQVGGFASVNNEVVLPQQIAAITDDTGNMVTSHIVQVGSDHKLRIIARNPDGTAITRDIDIPSYDGNTSLAQLNDGNIVVAYNNGTDLEFIFADPNSSYGEPAGPTGSFTVGAGYTNPAVTSLADGGFAILYEDGGNLFKQAYHANGTPNGQAEPINVTTAGTQENMAAITLASGDVAVVYESGGADDDITLQILGDETEPDIDLQDGAEIGGAGTLAIASGYDLDISGVTLSTAGGVANDGTLSVNRDFLTLAGGTFSGNGTLALNGVSGGDFDIDVTGNVTNAAGHTIAMTGDGTNASGTVTTGANVSITNAGMITTSNTADPFEWFAHVVNTSTGTLSLGSSVIIANGDHLDARLGKIETTGSSELAIKGTLTLGDLSDVDANILIRNNGTLSVADGETFTFSGDGAQSLSFQAGSQVSGTGIFRNIYDDSLMSVLDITNTTIATTTFENDGKVVVAGGIGRINSANLDNSEGTIAISGNSGPGIPVNTTLQFNGADKTLAGTLIVDTQGGQLPVHHTLSSGDGSALTLDGLLRVEADGAPAGTLEVGLDMAVSSEGAIDLDAGMQVTGQTSLAGELNFDSGSTTLRVGEGGRFTVQSGATFAGSAGIIAIANGGALAFDTDFSHDGNHFTLNSADDDEGATPEIAGTGTLTNLVGGLSAIDGFNLNVAHFINETTLDMDGGTLSSVLENTENGILNHTSGSFVLDGTLINDGVMNLGQGSIEGSGTLQNAGILDFTSASAPTYDMSAISLENAADATIRMVSTGSSAGTLVVDGFTNEGTLSMDATINSTRFTLKIGAEGDGVLTNDGLITIEGLGGETNVNHMTIDGSVAAGATGGTIYVADYQVGSSTQGRLQIREDLTLNDHSHTIIEYGQGHSGGYLRADGIFTFGGTFELRAGTTPTADVFLANGGTNAGMITRVDVLNENGTADYGVTSANKLLIPYFSTGAGFSLTRSTNVAETVNFTGTSGDDLFVGSTGDDAMTSGTDGADVFYGREGNDTFTLQSSAPNETEATIRFLDGGEGADTLNLDRLAFGQEDAWRFNNLEALDFSNVTSDGTFTLSADFVFGASEDTNALMNDGSVAAALTENVLLIDDNSAGGTLTIDLSGGDWADTGQTASIDRDNDAGTPDTSYQIYSSTTGNGAHLYVSEHIQKVAPGV